jgi:hypothetical protein
VHRCLLTTPMCEKSFSCQGAETCDRSLRPKRLCQPPACPVACLARLASREPWTCTHARICAQARYGNDLPNVEAMMPMIQSAITANGSDPGLNSLQVTDRTVGCQLPARRCLLTTPICENGLNCQGAETCERPLCQPPGCVTADGAKMSPCGPDCLNSRRPWKCVHTGLCARARYANRLRLPAVQAMMPMNLPTATTANGTQDSVPELAMPTVCPRCRQ